MLSSILLSSSGISLRSWCPSLRAAVTMTGPYSWGSKKRFLARLPFSVASITISLCPRVTDLRVWSKFSLSSTYVLEIPYTTFSLGSQAFSCWNLLLSCIHHLRERLHSVPCCPSQASSWASLFPTSWHMTVHQVLEIVSFPHYFSSQATSVQLQSHTLILISHLVHCIPGSCKISLGVFSLNPDKEIFLKMIIESRHSPAYSPSLVSP